MKIGFSLGRCVRDIVTGKISEDEVAFIIGATCIRDTDQLGHVINDYLSRSEYLDGLNSEDCHKVAMSIWNSNKLLQPRREGIHRHKQPANSIWVDMFPTECTDNPAVKTAWDNYRFMLHMTENIDTEAMETFK